MLALEHFGTRRCPVGTPPAALSRNRLLPTGTLDYRLQRDACLLPEPSPGRVTRPHQEKAPDPSPAARIEAGETTGQTIQPPPQVRECLAPLRLSLQRTLPPEEKTPSLKSYPMKCQPRSPSHSNTQEPRRRESRTLNARSLRAYMQRLVHECTSHKSLPSLPGRYYQLQP